jgi:hypothetical protein
MNEFWSEYLTLQSPSGDEKLANKCWGNEMKKIDTKFIFEVNNFGNVRQAMMMMRVKIHIGYWLLRNFLAYFTHRRWWSYTCYPNGGSGQTITL